MLPCRPGATRSRQGQAAAAGQGQGQPGAASGPGRAGLREGEGGGELRAWRRPARCSGAWCSPRAGTAPPSSSCTAQVAASFPLPSLLPSAAGQGLGGPRCLLRGLLGTAGPKGEEEPLRPLVSPGSWRTPRAWSCGLVRRMGAQVAGRVSLLSFNVCLSVHTALTAGCWPVPTGNPLPQPYG